VWINFREFLRGATRIRDVVFPQQFAAFVVVVQGEGGADGLFDSLAGGAEEQFGR
jgi:hypothetical protein